MLGCDGVGVAATTPVATDPRRPPLPHTSHGVASTDSSLVTSGSPSPAQEISRNVDTLALTPAQGLPVIALPREVNGKGGILEAKVCRPRPLRSSGLLSPPLR